MLTSLVAFSTVGAALYLLQRSEEVFFEQVQTEQTRFFADVQKALATRQQQDAERGLLAVHEAGHVNLTRVFANVLWAPSVAPFIAETQRLSLEPCRRLSNVNAAASGDSDARRICFSTLGKQIQSVPGFATLDAHAHAMMRNSSVFKIKVFDLRGLTVYSSEHGQIGEDKADNAGWQSAMHGTPASELTHRDRFSAFEGVVENRDLISSYVPVRAPDTDSIVGVFEIYSDVTPLLAQLRSAASRIEKVTAANQLRVEEAAHANESKVHASSGQFLAIVGGLLGLLYLALLWVVRNGQRIIDRQAEEQQRVAAREHLWHREKMAALAAMAANVSHEVGNALEIISGHAQEIADAQAKGEAPRCRPDMILEQTWRVANMTRRIADFASAQADQPEPVDLNQITSAVCDFLKFDRRFRGTALEFRAAGIPLIVVAVPDHLNEALINVVEAFVPDETAAGPESARVLVETSRQDCFAVVRLQALAAATGNAPAALDPLRDAKIAAAHRRIHGINGSLEVRAGEIEIRIPIVGNTPEAPGEASAAESAFRSRSQTGDRIEEPYAEKGHGPL